MLLFADLTERYPLHLAMAGESWPMADEIWRSTISARRQFSPEWLIDYAESDSPWELQKDKQGLNILHYAVMSKSIKRISKIHVFCDRHGIDILPLIKQPDLDGWTPLHWACRFFRKKVIEKLIIIGADPCALTKDGWSPRKIAIFHGTTNPQELDILPEESESDETLPDAPEPSLDGRCDICWLVSLKTQSTIPCFYTMR